MVVSPHFFFDESNSDELPNADSGNLIEAFEELDDHPKSEKGFWFAVASVSFGIFAAFLGVGVGLYADLEQRDLVNDYLATLGFEDLPFVQEVIEDQGSPVATFDDTTVYALELDKWMNRSLDLEKKINALEDENRYLAMAKDSLENILEGDVLDFASEDLGFSFQYPAKFGEVDLDVDTESEGGSFRGEFLNNSFLKFGGASVNYGEGSKLEFLDYGRFDGKGFIGNATLIEIIEVDGGRVTVFRGVDNVKGALGKGELGGLVDLNGDDFSSLAFHVLSEKEFSYGEFKVVLESLVIE